MERMEWDDIYSVNVEEIDTQHKRIISMINAIYDCFAARAACDRRKIQKILLDLIDYALVHFQTEEKYFQQFNYPDAPRHCRQHAEFSQKVIAFNQAFDSGKHDLKYDIQDFMMDWLSSHILESDKAYSLFFNQNGLK